MALFGFGSRDNNPQIQPIADQPDWMTLARIRRQDAFNWWEPQWDRHEKNWQYYFGKVFDRDEHRRAETARKALLEFNDYPTIINSATGREQVNRFRPALRGRDRGEKDPRITELLSQQFGIDDSVNDGQVAQAFSEVFRWIEQGCDADSEISDAFLDAFVCGIGNAYTYWDEMEGIEGKIKTEELKTWQVAWDPDASKRNMRDANYVFSLIWLQLEEAENLFPGKFDILQQQATMTVNQIGTRPSRAKTDRPIYRAPTSPNQFYKPDTRQVLVTKYEIKTRGDRWHFVDPITKTERLVDAKEWRRLKRFWKSEGVIEPDSDERAQWVYQKAWLAGDVALQDELEENDIPDYTVSAITCFPSKAPRGTIWFGPADLGRNPARWKSKMLSLWVDILASGPKGAVHAERGAFENVEEARKEIPRPDGLVLYNPGKLQGGAVQFGPGPQYPSGVDSLIQLASGGVWSSMGMNPLSAGMLDDPRRAPFQTVNALMQANQSVYAMPFDSLSFARKGIAKKYLLFIRDYLDPEVILRAVGHDHVPAVVSLINEKEQDEDGQPIEVPFSTWNRELYDAMLQYDVIADEVPSTPNQMASLFDILTRTDMFALLQQSGQAPPLDVLLEMFEAAGLPAVMADRWREQQAGTMTPEQQQVALQAILSELSPEVRQAVEADLNQPPEDGAVQ